MYSCFYLLISAISHDLNDSVANSTTGLLFSEGLMDEEEIENVLTNGDSARSLKMFLDCITKPCSVVVSRIGCDLTMPTEFPKNNNNKWVIRNLDPGGDDLKKTLKIVRSEEEPNIKIRKVSPLSLYTQIEDGLVTDVCCKRFKRRRHFPATRSKVKAAQQQNGFADDEDEADVRDVMDRMLHEVTLETMDGAEMARLVRAFCRDHGFNASEFDDPEALLRPSNVVDQSDCQGGYGGVVVVGKKRGHRKRRLKTFITRSVGARRVTSTPPKTGIVYISDSEEPNNKCWKNDEKSEVRTLSCEKIADEERRVEMKEQTDQEDSIKVLPMDITNNSRELQSSPTTTTQSPNEALPKKRLYGSITDETVDSNQPSKVQFVRVPPPTTIPPQSGLEESILRTLLLDPSESSTETDKSNLPVISDVMSLNCDEIKNNNRDSPEIVEVKVHAPSVERRKTAADVIHNLRLEIAALERLAAEKERERRFLLYFKSCKEELLKRLTPEPSPSPACKIKSDIFSSVKRMSESSFRPYAEARSLQTDTTNSYKSLMLTTAGQWSTSDQHQVPTTTLYGSCVVPLQAADFLRNKSVNSSSLCYPCYPPPPAQLLNNNNKDQWRRVPPNLVGSQFPIATREKPFAIYPQCVVCKVVKAAFLCSGCGKEWYCSENCQRQNWKHHSRMCSS